MTDTEISDMEEWRNQVDRCRLAQTKALFMRFLATKKTRWVRLPLSRLPLNFDVHVRIPCNP